MFTANIAANHALSCPTLAMRTQQSNRAGRKFNSAEIDTGKENPVRAEITLESRAFTTGQINKLINEMKQVIED